jgi:hypothetical protein
MSTVLSMVAMLANARIGAEKSCDVLGTGRPRLPPSPQPDEPGQSFYVPVVINGVPFSFLHDTGANQTYMDKETVRRHGLGHLI